MFWKTSTKTCCPNLNTINGKIPTKSFVGSATSPKSGIASSYSWKYKNFTFPSLKKAINFAENHTSISQENTRIIEHCRKPLSFYKNEPWKKKERDSSFDVTMDSYDGAEPCELTGIYIQSLLERILEKGQMGLNQDDGPLILRNINN